MERVQGQILLGHLAPASAGRVYALTGAGDLLGPEGKGIFDVVLHDPTDPAINYGLSCKMKELSAKHASGPLHLELSNSNKKFWLRLNPLGYNESNYTKYPKEVGAKLIEIVRSWHEDLSLAKGGSFDITHSYYLVLSYGKKGRIYYLHQLPLRLPASEDLTWSAPSTNRIVATDETGLLLEWYGTSGGQLKYYPLASLAQAHWGPLQLEPLSLTNEQIGIAFRAAEYFPHRWQAAVT